MCVKTKAYKWLMHSTQGRAEKIRKNFSEKPKGRDHGEMLDVDRNMKWLLI